MYVLVYLPAAADAFPYSKQHSATRPRARRAAAPVGRIGRARPARLRPMPRRQSLSAFVRYLL